MSNEENSKPLVVHSSDVWTESRRLRSIIFRSLVLKAWRRLLRVRLTATSPSDLGARALCRTRPVRRPRIAIAGMFQQRHAALLRPSLPVPMLAIVAAFVLMHVFAGAMLINATVSVVRSTQSEAQQSVASNRNDDLGDQAIIRNGGRK